MAVKGTTKGDLLQILIFTFLLCALFFGGWGGFVWWKNRARADFREKINRDITTMEKLYKDEENKRGLVNYRRQKQLRSGEEGSQLQEIINQVIDKMQPASRVKFDRGRSDKKVGKDAIELILNFGLEDGALRSIVEFCDLLERERPDVKITNLKLSRKLGKGGELKAELDDVWSTSQFSVSTYVTQEQSGKSEESAPAEESDQDG